MRFPPFLLGATVLFWGWMVGWLPAAIVGAVALELPRWIRWRWEFSAQDMNRLWDLCGLLFIGKAVIAYATSDLVEGSAHFMPWLPVIFFPFAAAHAFSAQDNVRLNTYFWLRRKKPPHAPSGWFVPYWYFVLCFLSVSSANVQDYRFYLGVAVLGGWLLWSCRGRNAPAWRWAMTLGCVAALGFAGQAGLTHLQNVTQAVLGQFIREFAHLDADVAQSRTAIGAVGTLKLSNRVLLRVETPRNQPPPALLRKASFDTYDGSSLPARWTTKGADFADVSAGAELGVWPLLPAGDTSLVARVTMFLPVGTGILPVPLGAAALTDLLAASVETNAYGTVRAREGQPLIRYTIRYGGTASVDPPPTPRDLAIPEAERATFRQVAAQLGLAGLPPRQAMARVSRYFADHFTYSRYLRGSRQPLRQFLLETRAGHCEYFATATALLLREAGVPTRYAIGYAVPEDDRGGTHLVRARHAHAWTLAYADGAWRDVDTTPATWEAIEEESRPPLQWVSDVFVWVKYQFARWRYYSDRGLLARIVFWLAPVVVAWFAWRIFARQRRARRVVTAVPVERKSRGIDSEFYRIEERLAQAGRGRRPDESLGDWLRREQLAEPLREALALHYAYRFDPRGITGEQRRELHRQVEQWLATAGVPGQSGRKSEEP